MGILGSLLHSRRAGAVATWLTLSSAAYGWIATLTPEWFGSLTWPQTILLGIAGSVGTTFILAVALAAFAYGFRLLRPLPVGDTEEVAAPYDDRVIQEQMTALTDVIEGVSARLDALQRSISRIKYATDFVEAGARAKIAAELLPEIERAREQHDAKRDSPIGTGRRKGPHTRITRLLPYLGAKAHGLEEAIKRRTEAITADGVTHTILPEDADTWSDGAKKRAWLIEDAKMEEMIAMLNRVIKDGSSPEDFLMNQRIGMGQ